MTKLLFAKYKSNIYSRETWLNYKKFTFWHSNHSDDIYFKLWYT